MPAAPSWRQALALGGLGLGGQEHAPGCRAWRDRRAARPASPGHPCPASSRPAGSHRAVAARALQAVATARGGQHFVAADQLETHLGDLANVVFVVDDQDASGRMSYSTIHKIAASARPRRRHGRAGWHVLFDQQPRLAADEVVAGADRPRNGPSPAADRSAQSWPSDRPASGVWLCRSSKRACAPGAGTRTRSGAPSPFHSTVTRRLPGRSKTTS